MSLKIIYGTVGNGKTKKCFDYIDNVINTTDENVVYVVPEQYSLEAERNISAEFSAKALDRVEVLSLERLARRVFSTVGPVMCDFVDDNAKLMVVEKSIVKVSGKLTYFTKNADVTGFASVILSLIKELKSNCIDSEALKNIAENSDSNIFKYKLYDLFLIYREYEKFFDFPYADSDNNMNLLSEKIEKYGLFKNTHFIFENFVSFSKQQMQVIASLMKNSPFVVFSFTADSLEYKNNFQLFYKAQLTVKKLFEIAYENNVEVLPNTYLDKSYGENEELEFLRSNYFADKKSVYTQKTKSVFLCKSDNYNNEIDQIAHEICRLVREENYRYRDFAVITRSTEIYYPIIRDTFERYGIFYNITEPKYSNSNFLYNALLSVFDIVINRYSFDSVFNFVRSCLCGLDEDSRFLLENYILETGNREQIWTDDKEITFRGTFSDYEFDKISRALKYVRGCLSAFTDKFKGRKTVGEIISAYSDFLQYVNAENKVKEIVKQFKNNVDNESAEETVSVYNHIITSVNQMSLYFGDVSITFEKFYKILDSALSNTEIDTLPSGVDDVMVTTIDRFQASKAKVVFAAGISEGVIPCGYINEGIFKDNELKSLGIENDIVQKHCDENYVIYRLFASAEEKLYISYPTGDNEGKGIAPSSIVTNIRSMFSDITEFQNVYEKINMLDEVEGVVPTLNKVIKNNAEGFWETVSKWYKVNKPELYDIIENANNYTNLPPKLQHYVVKKLYGNEIKSSISRVEKYNQCQFAYFLRYGLNVDERKEYKLEARDYGTYMHEIIEKFSLFAEDCGWKNITAEICREKAYEITNEILNENLSDFYTESERHNYLFNKIISAMNTVLWSITSFYQQSGYISLGHELCFDDEAEYKPITLTLSDGTVVKLRGKVDRADIRRTENGDFVSIVDYKSSAKDISFEKILCGIQIQLPVYISAVCKNLTEKGDNVIPAAMLYYHIDDPIVRGEKNMSDEDIAAEIEKELKMHGVIHESADIPSVFVAKKNVTINQINKLCTTAYRQMKNALEKMIDGNIAINPVNGNNSTACDYCPYGNICNFDPEFKDNKYRNYKKLKMEEFFEYVDQMDN